MSRCGLCGNATTHETPDIKTPAYPCQISNSHPCSPCRQMEELDDQISEEIVAIKKLLDGVKQKLDLHRELRTQANYLHNPLILQVPPEVASSIFHFYVFRPSDEYLASPLPLGAVCRSWRQIAWSNPELWNYISFVLNPAKFPTRCETVREWLGRSGQLPLSIRITSYPRHHPSDVEEHSSTMVPVINVINGYSSRWHDLNLRGVPPFLISHFVGDSPTAKIPILQVLHLGGSTKPSRYDRFRLNKVMPALTAVTLDSFPLRAVYIEWNNITEVNLYCIHLEECIEILRRSPQLVEYNIENMLARRRHPRWNIPDNPLVHSLLRLTVSPNHDDTDNIVNNMDMPIFFNSLVLPALQNFEYGNSYFPGGLEVVSLKSLFRRSTCPLTELYIGASFTDVEINDLLQGTPNSLRKLELQPWDQPEGYVPDSLLHLLASTSDDFLPSLESLTIHFVEMFPWDLVPDIFGPISEIGNPRRRPLRELQLCGPHDCSIRDIDKKVTLRLLELINAGISPMFRIIDGDSQDLLNLSMEYHGLTNGSG